MEIITKDTIKELFDKLKQLNNLKFEFIYTAKQNTFCYADIQEIYYKGSSIFIGNKNEILKFQEYRLNLEIDFMKKENITNNSIKKEYIQYIDKLKIRIGQIKKMGNDELIGITDEGDMLLSLIHI